MRYSITGVSRELSEIEKLWVMHHVMRLPDATEVTTGCAYGVDTIAHWTAVKFLPKAQTRLCIPAAYHNESLVHDTPRSRVILEYCERGRNASQSYMLRNDRLVHHGDVLVAFPERPVEQLRSGTWATVRRARLPGLVIQIHPLSESEGWEPPPRAIGERPGGTPAGRRRRTR